MRTRIVRIGNSRGVRIPKPLLEEAGLGDEVELRVVASGIIIESAGTARAGWAEGAARLREREGGVMLDEPAPPDFDESEWTW